jgi:hypothetical protein
VHWRCRLCWLSLEKPISVLMIIEIVFQFIPEVIVVFAMRMFRKEMERRSGCRCIRHLPWSPLVDGLRPNFAGPAAEQRHAAFVIL